MRNKVFLVSSNKQQGQIFQTSIMEQHFEGEQTQHLKDGRQLMLNYDLDQVDTNDFDCLILPGGRSAEFLRLDPKIMSVVQEMYKLKKPICATGHGIQFLTVLEEIKGRRITGRPFIGTL